MGGFKKIFKKVADPLKLFTADKVDVPKVKTPAQQLERQDEVSPDDITMGADDDTATKGKRALLRPAAGSSLGGV